MPAHGKVGQRWEVTTVRPLLRTLLELAPLPADLCQNTANLAAWLIQHGLGPLAYRACRADCPMLAAALQGDLYAAVAQNELHLANLEAIATQFQGDIPMVLLKGIALAESVYGGIMYRPMSDLDVWVPAEYLAQAIELMVQAGFEQNAKDKRPPELQLLSNGEIQFYQPHWVQNLIELHLAPFSGWWVKYTTAIETEAMWQRLEPLAQRPGMWQLAAEDAVIHFAVHTAVNHQFDLHLIRSLVDIALTAQKRGVDWQVVAKRARRWRVATAVYTVLTLLHQLIGLPELEPALDTLRPSFLRRWLFSHILAPEKAINGFALPHPALRFPLLLLLVDRPRDAAKMIFRTLWPEKAWLQARYGGHVSRWGHLWGMLRRGDV
ncbi:MAG: nucleotidyltransferase family protein [Chloroflexota bacterium]